MLQYNFTHEYPYVIVISNTRTTREKVDLPKNPEYRIIIKLLTVYDREYQIWLYNSYPSLVKGHKDTNACQTIPAHENQRHLS